MTKPVTPADIFALLSELAPPALAEQWDNVGLLVDTGRPVTGVLVTLDITPSVVQEAAALGCELIVSHHPVIFAPLKRLGPEDVPFLLARQEISAVCMHTNLDACPGGVNDTLTGLLGMEDAEPFANGCGRVGRLAWNMPPTVPEVAALCKKVLCASVKYSDTGRPVQRLAVVSGAGGSLWEEALAQGADCLVTGEANHHQALDAARLGLSIVAAGHYETEQPVVGVLAAWLREKLPGLRVVCSEQQENPFTYC